MKLMKAFHLLYVNSNDSIKKLIMKTKLAVKSVSMTSWKVSLQRLNVLNKFSNYFLQSRYVMGSLIMLKATKTKYSWTSHGSVEEQMHHMQRLQSSIHLSLVRVPGHLLHVFTSFISSYSWIKATSVIRKPKKKQSKVLFYSYFNLKVTLVQFQNDQ